jgi:membrane-bound serine protease (ClpP class)
METVFLIIVLVLVALALIVVEICTPTFGTLALVALAALAWGVYLAFTLSSVFGIVMIVALVLTMPVFLYWAVKVLPNTALGRRLALRKKPADPGEGTPEADDLAGLVGVQTTAETVLRPSGTIRVEGRRIVAQAEGGFIEKGAAVRIVRAAGTHVVVRQVES